MRSIPFNYIFLVMVSILILGCAPVKRETVPDKIEHYYSSTTIESLADMFKKASPENKVVTLDDGGLTIIKFTKSRRYNVLGNFYKSCKSTYKGNRYTSQKKHYVFSNDGPLYNLSSLVDELIVRSNNSSTEINIKRSKNERDDELRICNYYKDSGNKYGEFKRNEMTPKFVAFHVNASTTKRLQSSYLIFAKNKTVQPIINKVIAKHIPDLIAAEPERKRKQYEANKRWGEKMKRERKERDEREGRSIAKAKIKRQSNALIISNESNIGAKICKNGTLNYQHSTGYKVMGKLRTEARSENGQIMAFLEGFSKNGQRIKFSILGHATPSGRLNGSLVSHPKMGDFILKPSSTYWDDVSDWFLCS